MIEIQKDIRLPNGFVSWVQVAMSINNLINLKESSDGERYALHIYDKISPSSEEIFEIDILTLKAMVFNEIIDLIPSVEYAETIAYSMRKMRAQAKEAVPDPIYEDAINHFKKIINLFNE